MNRLLIAIDPGWKGAIAGRLPDGEFFWSNCPPIRTEMQSLIKDLDFEHKTCYIERQQPRGWTTYVNSDGQKRSGQSSKSVWSLGENYFTWLNVCELLGFKVVEILPIHWQRKLTCKLQSGDKPEQKKMRKNQIKQLAQQTYPQFRATLFNSDALMLLHVANQLELQGGYSRPEPKRGKARKKVVPNLHDQLKLELDEK